MKTVVKKEDLLKKIKINKDKHREIFLEAVEGYRAEALSRLEEKIDRIKRGKLVDLAIIMPTPEDHTRHYDRAIEMISMDIRVEIELEEEEFAQYVMDDWVWKRAWESNTLAYASPRDTY